MQLPSVFFVDKKRECETYLAFLGDAEKTSSALTFSKGRRSIPKELDDDTRKILKASFFVLYYSFVESVVKHCVKYIAYSVKLDDLVYQRSSDSIQRVWIETNFFKILEPPINSSRVLDRICANTSNVANEQVLNINADTGFSYRKLDAENIRRLSHKFGVSFSPPPSCRGGLDLETIVSRRNALAHGDETYLDVGQDYTVRDLRALRRKCDLFLRSFARGSEKFVATGKHKV